MKDSVQPIVHQVLVPKHDKVSSCLSATNRVITVDAIALNRISKIYPTKSCSLYYFLIEENLDFLDLKLLFERKSFLPAHPVLLASDCIARPAFSDEYSTFTFWEIESHLFGCMLNSKVGGTRKTSIFSKSLSESLGFSKKLLLATVAK